MVNAGPALAAGPAPSDDECATTLLLERVEAQFAKALKPFPKARAKWYRERAGELIKAIAEELGKSEYCPTNDCTDEDIERAIERVLENVDPPEVKHWLSFKWKQRLWGFGLLGGIIGGLYVNKLFLPREISEFVMLTTGVVTGTTLGAIVAVMLEPIIEKIRANQFADSATEVAHRQRIKGRFLQKVFQGNYRRNQTVMGQQATLGRGVHQNMMGIIRDALNRANNSLREGEIELAARWMAHALVQCRESYSDAEPADHDAVAGEVRFLHSNEFFHDPVIRFAFMMMVLSKIPEQLKEFNIPILSKEDTKYYRRAIGSWYNISGFLEDPIPEGAVQFSPPRQKKRLKIRKKVLRAFLSQDPSTHFLREAFDAYLNLAAQLLVETRPPVNANGTLEDYQAQTRRVFEYLFGTEDLSGASPAVVEGFVAQMTTQNAPMINLERNIGSVLEALSTHVTKRVPHHPPADAH